jgi:CHAP domain
MKKLVKLFATVLVSISFLTSCNHEEIQPLTPTAATTTEEANSRIQASSLNNEVMNSVQSSAAAAVTYTTSTSIGSWTNGSSGNLNLSCGLFQGGLKAKVTSIVDNKISVQIQRTDGKPFGAGGTGYMKATDPCGSIAGNSSWSRTDFYFIDVTFWATFTSGSVTFYPTITLSNNVKMYANPIIVTAKEVSSGTTGGLQYGSFYGSSNGVNVYSNGSNPLYGSDDYNTVNGYNTGMKWQCVEFVNRYYLQVYGTKIRIAGQHAYQYFGNASQRGLKAYANNGSTSPQVGDILCLSGNTYGHVAIITAVTSTYIEVAQQNVGKLSHLNFRFAKSGNNILASALGSGYSIQGWLRK